MGARVEPTVPRLTIVAWPGLELAALTGKELVLGRSHRTAVQSASLDTTDHRLARAGVVVDRAGSDWVVRCGSYGTRTFADCATEPPPELLASLAGLARGAPLVPIVRVRRSGRSRGVWPAPEEGQANPTTTTEPIGRLIDEDVSVLDGRRIVYRQRYVTIEGDRHLVEHVRSRLVALGMHDRLVDSLEQHLALGPPEPVPWPLEETPTAAAVIQRALARSVARLLAHDPVVRLDLHVEGVHQMRVATRRLRSDLRTFRAFLDDVDVLDDLRWLAGLLGEVRDPDVLLERLETAISHLDPADQEIGESFERRLVSERDAALVRVHEALDGSRYGKLIDRLVKLAENPPLNDDARRPAVDALVPHARAEWRKLRKAARRAGEPDATVSDVHEMRIRAKRFRYAVDALAEVEPAAKAHAERIAGLQDVLGDFNDAVVAEAWLRGVAANEHDPARMLVLGQLVMSQRALVEQDLAKWDAAWRPVSRRKRRAWLDR